MNSNYIAQILSPSKYWVLVFWVCWEPICIWHCWSVTNKFGLQRISAFIDFSNRISLHIGTSVTKIRIVLKTLSANSKSSSGIQQLVAAVCSSLPVLSKFRHALLGPCFFFSVNWTLGPCIALDNCFCCVEHMVAFHAKICSCFSLRLCLGAQRYQNWSLEKQTTNGPFI
jgi:hypothetical protein